MLIMTKKTRDKQRRPYQKTGVNFGAPEVKSVPVAHVNSGYLKPHQWCNGYYAHLELDRGFESQSGHT